MQKVLVFTLILISTFNFAAYAGGPGTSGAQFLKIGVGARSIAMGETGSISEDANSIYWNPAGLAGISQKEVSLMYGMWIETINFNHLALALPFKFGTLGIGTDILGMGAMDKYDNSGAKVGQSFTASDTAITLTYAKAMKAGDMPLNVGINLKSISSTIDSTNASAIGFDLGAQIKLKGDRIVAGLVIQNLGSGMSFKLTSTSPTDPLPMNIKVGGSYSFISDNQQTLLTGLDINMPNDNDIRYNLGAEYTRNVGKDIKLAGRAGYRSNTKGLEGLAGLTFGVGFGIKSYSLDWAFVPYGQLGDTHRISFSARF